VCQLQRKHLSLVFSLQPGLWYFYRNLCTDDTCSLDCIPYWKTHFHSDKILH
jgi:hypothetical protein